MVETGGLENRLALTGYGGSNPSPSATSSSKDIPNNPEMQKQPRKKWAFVFLTVSWRRVLPLILTDGTQASSAVAMA